MAKAVGPTDVYQHFHVDDFSPGIATQPGFNYPTGQAADGTVGCFTLGSALEPLFLADSTIDGDTYSVTPTPTATPGFIVNGLFVTGTVIPITGTRTDNLYEVFIGTTWGTGSGATGTLEFRMQRIQAFVAALTRETINTETHAGVGDYTFGWGVDFAETRMNRADPLTPGIPIVAYSWGYSGGGFVDEYPNDSTPTLSTPYVVTSGSQFRCLTHQGRIVCFDSTVYDVGDNAKWNSLENVLWTPVNDPTSVSILQAFYPERADGYAAFSSMSANELFLAKVSNLLVISGDLDNPLVINYPMAEGGGTVGTSPARSRIGLVYGNNRTGVWVWAHSDTSLHLSQPLDPEFWLPPSNQVTGNQASFHAVGQFVWVSNGWLYDTDSRAWWRYDNTHQHRYLVGYDRYIFASRPTYTVEDPVAVDRYDLLTRRPSYTWISHPIRESVDSRIAARQCTIRAIGSGTVTVSTTTDEGSFSIDFTVSSTYPTVYRQNWDAHGTVMQIQIDSTGDPGDDPSIAPTVWELDMEYDFITKTPTTGAITP